MVMDQQGNNLYFGSPRELMVYSTAVQLHHQAGHRAPRAWCSPYLRTANSCSSTIRSAMSFISTTPRAAPSSTFGGLGACGRRGHPIPIRSTSSIVQLSVAQSHQYALRPQHQHRLEHLRPERPPAARRVWPSPFPASAHISQAIRPLLTPGARPVPGSGQPATVRNNASIQFYPQSDSVNLPTSVLGATTDGAHILGASLNWQQHYARRHRRQYSTVGTVSKCPMP